MYLSFLIFFSFRLLFFQNGISEITLCFCQISMFHSLSLSQAWLKICRIKVVHYFPFQILSKTIFLTEKGFKKVFLILCSFIEARAQNNKTMRVQMGKPRYLPRYKVPTKVQGTFKLQTIERNIVFCILSRNFLA